MLSLTLLCFMHQLFYPSQDCQIFCYEGSSWEWHLYNVCTTTYLRAVQKLGNSRQFRKSLKSSSSPSSPKSLISPSWFQGEERLSSSPVRSPCVIGTSSGVVQVGDLVVAAAATYLMVVVVVQMHPLDEAKPQHHPYHALVSCNIVP